MLTNFTVYTGNAGSTVIINLILINRLGLKAIQNLVFIRHQREYKYTQGVCLFEHGTTTAGFTMVLKLYGVYGSPWVRLVVTVLLEKQVPFELVSVDFASGEHKSPEYLEKHPFGQIPYIVCDSLNLFTCQRNRNLLNISYSGT